MQSLLAPVIFLDFDGVLNHYQTGIAIEERWKACGASKILKPPTLADWLDVDLVKKVGALAEETGALIAIVSSWRNRYDGTTLRKILRQRGLPATITIHKCAHNCTKGEALDRYLKRHVVQQWVVLDDDIGFLGELTSPKRLVRTSGAVGVTDADLARAKRILQGEL